MNIYWKPNEKFNKTFENGRKSEKTYHELSTFVNRLKSMGKLVRVQNIGKHVSKIDVSFMFEASFQSQKLERIFRINLINSIHSPFLMCKKQSTC